MKKDSIISVLVFLLLSGTTVHAQNSQTSANKEITGHSEQTDKIVGKKIEQNTLLSGNRFEKLETVKAPAVKAKPHNRKPAHKKKKKQ